MDTGPTEPPTDDDNNWEDWDKDGRNDHEPSTEGSKDTSRSATEDLVEWPVYSGDTEMMYMLIVACFAIPIGCFIAYIRWKQRYMSLIRPMNVQTSAEFGATTVTRRNRVGARPGFVDDESRETRETDTFDSFGPLSDSSV